MMDNDRPFNFLLAQGISNIGKCRNNNEDSFLLMPEEGCFFVADGCGGCDAGEVASKFVVTSLEEHLRDSVHDSPGERRHCTNIALQDANDQIRKYAREHGFRIMASTVVGLVFDTWEPNKVWVCHVGDSRAYHFGNEGLTQLTVDHSTTASIKDITPEMRGKLTRAVGADENLEVEWSSFKVSEYDILFLCSDGLTVHLSNDDLAEILKGYKLIGLPIAETLVEFALERGGKDNVTAISVKVGHHLPPPLEVSDIERQESDYWADK